MSKPTLTVIIPAFNEERTIASVVEIVRAWGKADQIIVVDDGSKDNTLDSLKHFKDAIILISLPDNQGKSYAVCEGIKRATGDLIMLLDADLLGLTHHALDLFLRPMLTHKFSMVIGTPRAHGLGDQQIYYQLSGQRLLWRRDLLPLLNQMSNLGYGLEVFLNAQFPASQTFYTPLPYVYLRKRYEKYGFIQSNIGYLKEIIEVTRQMFIQLFRFRL